MYLVAGYIVLASLNVVGCYCWCRNEHTFMNCWCCVLCISQRCIKAALHESVLGKFGKSSRSVPCRKSCISIQVCAGRWRWRSCAFIYIRVRREVVSFSVVFGVAAGQKSYSYGRHCSLNAFWGYALERCECVCKCECVMHVWCRSRILWCCATVIRSRSLLMMRCGDSASADRDDRRRLRFWMERVRRGSVHLAPTPKINM